LTDGQSLDFQIVLDRKADDISAQLSLTAKPGSPLANLIAKQGSRTSRFGPLAGSAVQGALKLSVPEVLLKPLSEAIEDGFKQEQGRQKDAVKKDLAQKVFNVFAPTLKAGELDVFAGFAGPNADGKYTLAGGIKVKEAAKIEQLARDLAPMIPDPKAKEAIAFDAETIGDVKVHKITASRCRRNARVWLERHSAHCLPGRCRDRRVWGRRRGRDKANCRVDGKARRAAPVRGFAIPGRGVGQGQRPTSEKSRRRCVRRQSEGGHDPVHDRRWAGPSAAGVDEGPGHYVRRQDGRGREG